MPDHPSDVYPGWARVTTDEENSVDESHISTFTGLPTKTLVLLIVFLPAILLIILLWMSYTISPWT